MSRHQQSIRFTTTSDGIDIGFWELGTGPPLLLAQNRSLSHAEMEWDVPSMAALYTDLARYFRLIRFDPRGSGVSGEPPPDGVTHEGLAADIHAVSRAVGVEELNVMGVISLGPAAVLYSATHAEAVSRLILCDTGPRLSDLPLDSYVRATDALVDIGVLPSLGSLFPSTPTTDLPALERLMRGSLYDRPKTRPRDLRTFDVTDILGRVAAPTLVIKSQDSVYTDLTQTRALLSGIPNSELKVVPGTMAPWLADRDEVVEAIVSFTTSGHHRPEQDLGEGILTIVFTDIVSSTSTLQEMGDSEGRRTFREIEQLTSNLGSRYGGSVVKMLGDGAMLTFRSTRQALAFALDLQDSMSSRPVKLRVGISAGEPVREQSDVHGVVVVQASRVADIAQPGEVVVSDIVRQLAMGKDFTFDPLDDVVLRGFDDPLRVWRATTARPRAAHEVVDSASD